MRWGAVLGALALNAPLASGQVMIGSGVGIVYGPLVPVTPWTGVLYAPPPYVLVDPWLAAPRSPETSPSCYRYGRCTAADIAAHRHRVDRLERLAPSAPADPRAWDLQSVRPPLPPPTPEENIRPEYRGAGVVREEFAGSGQPVAPVKPE